MANKTDHPPQSNQTLQTIPLPSNTGLGIISSTLSRMLIFSSLCVCSAPLRTQDRITDLLSKHPVKFFVPKNVHENLPVLYMAPSTDPLDGLNKMYGRASVRYYRQYFNQLSQAQCGIKIDWDRGYVCQIARFDPSKGMYLAIFRPP